MVGDKTQIRKCTSRYLATSLDDEIILVHADSGAFYSLKETARLVWQQIDETPEIGRICEALTREYAIDDGECRRDVMAFIEDIVAAGFAEFA